VADIGAGTGYFEPYLSAAVGQSGSVLALDIEPDMVRYLTERAEREGMANVVANRVDVDDPKLAPRSVDRILIVDTWHHIPDRVAYAQKLRQALADDGTVTIVDFTLDSEHGPPRHHRLSPEAVIGELEKAGFRASTVNEALPNQYVVVGR
jgi:SAM-dependent methyltransferase